MLTHLGIDEADLTGDDYGTTRTIATKARAAGFDGVLAASAALPGQETLVVFADALTKIRAERSEIRQPPPRLADLLPLIRPHEGVPAVHRGQLRALPDQNVQIGSAMMRSPS